MINLPNLLTFIRIATIPFLVLVFYIPIPWGHTAASIIFALASLTDWLDGYLARSLKQSTKLGAFLDPVADKLVSAVVAPTAPVKVAVPEVPALTVTAVAPFKVLVK